jgi:23S rRNA A2030 N6-methylase RlmJ
MDGNRPTRNSEVTSSVWLPVSLRAKLLFNWEKNTTVEVNCFLPVYLRLQPEIKQRKPNMQESTGFVIRPLPGLLSSRVHDHRANPRSPAGSPLSF